LKGTARNNVTQRHIIVEPRSVTLTHDFQPAYLQQSPKQSEHLDIDIAVGENSVVQHTRSRPQGPSSTGSQADYLHRPPLHPGLHESKRMLSSTKHVDYLKSDYKTIRRSRALGSNDTASCNTILNCAVLAALTRIRRPRSCVLHAETHRCCPCPLSRSGPLLQYQNPKS
jgi:hypothetical protein